mgnify:CR=1 FL=1
MLIILGCSLINSEKWGVEKITKVVSQFCKRRYELDSSLSTSLLPSEIKFFSDFQRLCQSGKISTLISQKIIISEITLQGIPEFGINKKCNLFFMIFQKGEVVANGLISQRGLKIVDWSEPKLQMKMEIPVGGSFLITFYHKIENNAPEKMFEIPLNTG